MPPKKGGGCGAANKRTSSLDDKARRSATQTTNTTNNSTPGNNQLDAKTNKSKLSIALIIVEGVKLNKMQLNDIIKQHPKDIKITDIQLSRSGGFTLYASDVSSFSRILNELAAILATNGQAGAKIYVPRSIQRVQDTEKFAFVKRVDLEIPESRITEALKDVGLNTTDDIRPTNKDRNMPTTTIKITFYDPQNRNTFIYSGLQVDSMHFTAEPASQNVKPVQCYLFLKYNHVAKYCKSKEQLCARCGENHRVDHCTAAADLLKCSNCKGAHLATSNICPSYQEQEKRMLNLVNQYSTTNKLSTTVPALNNLNEFPSLPNLIQHQHDYLQNGLLDELVNALTSKMEKITEETARRLFKTLQQKITKLEKSILAKQNIMQDEYEELGSDLNEEESQVSKYIKNKQQKSTDQNRAKQSNINTLNTASIISTIPTTSSNNTSAKTTTSNEIVAKPQRKQKVATKPAKRTRSPNSSLDSTTLENKDLKPSNNDD